MAPVRTSDGGFLMPVSPLPTPRCPKLGFLRPPLGQRPPPLLTCENRGYEGGTQGYTKMQGDDLRKRIDIPV